MFVRGSKDILELDADDFEDMLAAPADRGRVLF